ncbi:hypothetical protein PMIN02_010710 [Paraphaeosphaeria minitans]
MNSGVAAAHTIKSMDGRICKGSQKNFLKTDNALTPPPCKWHLGKYWKKLWTNDIRPTVAVACNTWFHLISIILGGVFNLLQAHLFTAVVAWLFPRPILKLLKYSIVGAVGHLVLGLASLRWFKEYRNETLPLIKLFGYEFTVRNEYKYKPEMVKRVFEGSGPNSGPTAYCPASSREKVSTTCSYSRSVPRTYLHY